MFLDYLFWIKLWKIFIWKIKWRFDFEITTASQLCLCVCNVSSIHTSGTIFPNIIFIRYSSTQISALTFCCLLVQSPHLDSQGQFGCALILFYQIVLSCDFLCFSQICHLIAPCLQCSKLFPRALLRLFCGKKNLSA